MIRYSHRLSFLLRTSVIGFTTVFVTACMPAVYENAEYKYPVRVENKPYIVEIPVAGESLTPVQKRRLSRMAQLHSMYGESEITIASPQGNDTRLKVSQIVAELNSHGVTMDQIMAGAYVPDKPEVLSVIDNKKKKDESSLVEKTPSLPPPPAIVVSFKKFTATTDDCDDKWALDTTRSVNTNAQSDGLGCATQNNLAVMLADPSDFIAPRPSVPVSAENRGRVLDAYRKGELPSTPTLESQDTQ